LLGHFGVCVKEFDKQVEWYTKNFNLVPTDFLHVGEGNQKRNVAVFAHIDRGEELVDHHTFFMTTNETSHVHHCSFEVHDFDTQALGHQWLGAKNYTSVWGLGRHILGSQIFDYWWDTTGNMIEHYADGDLVNSTTPVGYAPAGHESLAVWGPEVPRWCASTTLALGETKLTWTQVPRISVRSNFQLLHSPVKHAICFALPEDFRSSGTPQTREDTVVVNLLIPFEVLQTIVTPHRKQRMRETSRKIKYPGLHPIESVSRHLHHISGEINELVLAFER
jgi:Glyoxalase/Bleomycin resistance protein/Dioxygenase superfamily